MGRPVFDADRELAGGLREVGLQQAANPVRIDLFFHLQLCYDPWEVNATGHVGLPHTALHVVHGKGMLGVLGERHLFVFFALPVELIILIPKDYAFGVTFQRLIILVVAFFNLADVGVTVFLPLLLSSPNSSRPSAFARAPPTSSTSWSSINTHTSSSPEKKNLMGTFLSVPFSFFPTTTWPSSVNVKSNCSLAP